MKKSMGKPYAGKPHVRFEEGVRQELIKFLTTLLYWQKEKPQSGLIKYHKWLKRIP